MPTQVIWGKLNFNVAGNIIRGVDGFKASISIKEKDSESKKKFTELEEVSFSVKTSLETGGNPIKDYNYLKTYIKYPKKGYALQINEGSGFETWKGLKFLLEKVDLSDTKMDSRGRIHAGTINLTFREKNKKLNKKKVKKFRQQSELTGTW
jgi:hypothetical protein